jgi:hypothetical protein
VRHPRAPDPRAQEYVASIGNIASGPAPALYPTVEQRGAATPNDLKVRSIDAAGNEVDPGVGNGFHISVVC